MESKPDRCRSVVRVVSLLELLLLPVLSPMVLLVFALSVVERVMIAEHTLC